MNVGMTTMLTAWTLRPLAVLIVILLAVLYARGWRRTAYAAENRHPRLFIFSLAVFLFALTSPINHLVNTFFFMRVAQQLLLISLFPATFMAADPLPILLAGLPGSRAAYLTRLARRYRPFLTHISPKGICWFIFVASVWLWYDQRLLALTMTSAALYDLALVMMISGAFLHWWHVMAAWPHLHQRLPSLTHMGYTLAGAAPLKIPGLFLLFAVIPIYAYPPAMFFGQEISPLLSQQLGGILVWVLGGSVYSTTAFRFLAAWLDTEENKPEQPRSLWDNKDSLIAPHLE